MRVRQQRVLDFTKGHIATEIILTCNNNKCIELTVRLGSNEAPAEAFVTF